MKPVDIKVNTYIDSMKLLSNKEVMIKILNLKLVVKDTHQIGLKRFFYLKKLKIQFHGHMLLMI